VSNESAFAVDGSPVEDRARARRDRATGQSTRQAQEWGGTIASESWRRSSSAFVWQSLAPFVLAHPDDDGMTPPHSSDSCISSCSIPSRDGQPGTNADSADTGGLRLHQSPDSEVGARGRQQGDVPPTLRSGVHPPSGKRREVPMNSATGAALHALGDKTEGYVFRKTSGVAWGSIRTAFERAVRDAKLDDFTFHDLRHTFASHFMMRGGNLAELRDLLGHADIKMTTRYAHLSPSHLRAAVDKLEGLTPTKAARISTSSTHEVESDPLPLVSTRNAGVAQRQSN
jgi:hypothetical protein